MTTKSVLSVRSTFISLTRTFTHASLRVRTETQVEQTMQDIAQLRRLLAEAEQDRKNQLEYDVVAERVLTLPTRQASQACVLTLSGTASPLLVHSQKLAAFAAVRLASLLACKSRSTSWRSSTARSRRVSPRAARSSQTSTNRSRPCTSPLPTLRSTHFRLVHIKSALFSQSAQYGLLTRSGHSSP